MKSYELRGKFPTAQSLLEALDSGQYRRARGILVTIGDEHRHCCLGVGLREAGVTDREMFRSEAASATGYRVVAVITSASVRQSFDWLAATAPPWLCAKADEVELGRRSPVEHHEHSEDCRTVEDCLIALNDNTGNWLPVKNALRRLAEEGNGG